MTQALEVLAYAHLLLQLLICDYNMLILHNIRYSLVDQENWEEPWRSSGPTFPYFRRQETVWPKSQASNWEQNSLGPEFVSPDSYSRAYSTCLVS